MYEVPESKRSIKQNQFQFTIPEVGEFSLPKIGYIPIDIAEQADANGGIGIRTMARLLGLDKLTEALGQLDGIQISELTLAWYQASGAVTPGESEAS